MMISASFWIVSYKKKKQVDSQVRSMGTHPLHRAWNRRRLLHPIKLAYDPRCRKAGS